MEQQEIAFPILTEAQVAAGDKFSTLNSFAAGDTLFAAGERDFKFFIIKSGEAAIHENSSMGDSWGHLRLCLSCGHVGCCDSSKNKHAAKHYDATDHPIVKSLEPGENWRWCYPEQLFME